MKKNGVLFVICFFLVVAHPFFVLAHIYAKALEIETIFLTILGALHAVKVFILDA